MSTLRLLVAAATMTLPFAAHGQATINIYDVQFGGPGTASINNGPLITGSLDLRGSGKGRSSAGSGPGFIAESVPLDGLTVSFYSETDTFGGGVAMPGVFQQQNVDPGRYQVIATRTMSMGGVTITGNFNLSEPFSRNLSASCVRCRSTLTTEGGNVITFEFAGGPQIGAWAGIAGVVPIPEPTTMLLVGSGLALFGMAGLRRNT